MSETRFRWNWICGLTIQLVGWHILHVQSKRWEDLLGDIAKFNNWLPVAGKWDYNFNMCPCDTVTDWSGDDFQIKFHATWKALLKFHPSWMYGSRDHQFNNSLFYARNGPTISFSFFRSTLHTSHFTLQYKCQYNSFLCCFHFFGKRNCNKV